MNIGFSPISQRISYTAKTKPQPKPQTPEEKEMKEKLGREYMSGFLSGALVASAIAGGIYISNPDKTDYMMQDLKMEYTDKNKQNLIIEDLNDDNCPEIVVVNSDDERVIYDFNNEKVYLEDKGVRTEWGY